MSLFGRKNEDRRKDSGPSRDILLDTTPAAATVSAPEAGGEGAEQETQLGRDCRIFGKLGIGGNFRIAGVVEGEIDGDGVVSVQAGAVVNARIRARIVLIDGEVTADIEASERVEIGRSGRLRGNVAAAALVVHEGAWFEGNCSMTGSRPAVAPAPAADPVEKAVVAAKLTALPAR
ncbi:MAG: polymer-forming cytoskeletal protein [Deltaproteobacteria bacterium]|nr:polymer-forming cytoskeletal protein [Deltaproteobacteria bacterium]